jgi:2,4-dienoyl-CoA reductase-like NADH-dependent reductase (Old Yellow Enzyme family)
MPHLFDSFRLRGVNFRNRIGIAPMCQYSYDNGFSNEWQLIHLGSRAIGGAGLVMAEATAVEDRGRISPQDLGIWTDEHVEPLARVVRAIEEHGALSGIQIGHAGRKASVARPWDGGKSLADDDGGWPIVGPSDLPFADGYRTPHALTVEEIQEVQAAFVSGATRALAAGFRVLELHGAHGYLIHSFLSPISNQRDDSYGGSFDNRIRFLIETTRQVRAVWPEEFPLFVRLSATDWVDGGWTLEESVELSTRLAGEGVDLIDASSGGSSPRQAVPTGASYQVPLSEAIRRGANLPTAAVGLITEPMQADEIVRNGRADLVLLGRESLRSPYWPIDAARALGHADLLPRPNQYARA